MGSCFSGLLDGSDLLAMLLEWCVGDGLFVVVWLARLGEVGLLVATTFSSGVGLVLVSFVDGRMSCCRWCEIEGIFLGSACAS
jgi:hypothetical protein